MPFDNGADKFTGSEHEKEMLISAIKKQKQRIISKLQDIFVDVNNVKVRLTNKGQQISHLFPVVGCQTQEHNLKRRLVRKKHRWTEEEAACHVSFCTRLFKHIRKFVKYGIMIPRFCTNCNVFFQGLTII